MPFVRIEGLVELDDETSHEEFMEQFLAWLEENGWDFEGTSSSVDEEEGEG